MILRIMKLLIMNQPLILIKILNIHGYFAHQYPILQ